MEVFWQVELNCYQYIYKNYLISQKKILVSLGKKGEIQWTSVIMNYDR